VRQVLLNLAGNAVKFTQQGHVLIDVAREAEIEGGALVRFSVIDSGIGIAPETMGKLFRPYAQADSTMTRKFGGTGLGLAISKQLVRLMGGEIGVRSELGKGSTFWFTLPLMSAENPLVEVDALRTVAPQADPGRILLVEDNPVNAKITTRLLEKFGHSVSTAANGAQACAAYTRESFDLILMDVMMPEMDGLEATAEIRSLERGGGYRTPIVALTASAMESDRRRCEAAGMDDYLTKPLSPNLLAEKVQHWLAVSRSANPRRPSQNVPACEEQGSSRDEQPEIGAKAARMHS
jgi:CheY-like chemotaxis protein